VRRLTIFSCTVGLAIGLAALPAGATSSSTLRSLLVHKGEMQGFSIDGSPGMGTTPATFVKNIYKLSGSTAASDVTALEAEGFTGGASEYLRSSKGVAASQVWVFKNAHDATGFLQSTFARAETELPKGSTVRPLEVGVGGAHAFSASSGKVFESDDYMALGRCMLFVGDEIEGTAARANAPVVAASRTVHGRAGAVCS
jgi:hypothetical protein